MLQDKFGRDIHDLRLSVTDRCNFSCVYCKSADPKNYFPHRDLLTWDEFFRIARVLAMQGIRKVRITGGEPLLRHGVVEFIGRLRQIPEIEDIAITTNGYLLPEMAKDLASAENIEENAWGQLALGREPGTQRALSEASGSLGGLQLPRYLAHAPDCGVVLLDRDRARLKKFDPCECRFVTVPCTGGVGAGIRQFNQPRAIAICGDNLLVADSGNGRLVVYSLLGFLVRGIWSPPPSELGQPWQPVDVAVSRDRKVLVADVANGCIHVFNFGGRWLRAITRYGGTWSGAPDFAFDLCCKRVREDDLQQLDLSSWQVVANGSEPVRKETIDRFVAAFGPSGFRPEAMMPSYGLAEAVVFASGTAERRTPSPVALDAEALGRGAAIRLSGREPRARWYSKVGSLRASTSRGVNVVYHSIDASMSRTRALGLPIKLSATPGAVTRPAPTFGQHTREVLGEFGFAAAEIDALYASNAVA